ncbi:hypothetical protein SpCBS45565_g01202 [Spizellomyces sp. 'palustris']|nr:hypothetical protein SpCBS45565_g01202 [Spizellomyces sp. 'palustris']
MKTPRSVLHFISVLNSVSFAIINPLLTIFHDILFWFFHLLRWVPSFEPKVPSVAEQPIVLVTGASKGIGRCIAMRLAERGYEVFAGIRSTEDGESLVAEFEDKVKVGKGKGSIHTVMLDVTKPEDVSRAVQTVIGHCGPKGLAGLINNAGGAIVGPLELIRDEDFFYSFDVNLFQAYKLTKRFLPVLRLAKGRLINISSMMAWTFHLPGFGAYHVGKAALSSLSTVWRRELFKSGVAVSFVEPGSIQSEIWTKGFDSIAAHESQKEKTAGFQTFSTDPIYSDAPPELKKMYQPLFKMCEEMADLAKEEAIPPDHVAAAVVHAMTRRWPKERYLVGMDALWLNVMQTFVPEWMSDVLGFRSW